MNITHMVENLARGGLERVVLDLIGRQHQAGHRCQVVCLYDEGVQAGELREMGVPITACNKRSGPDLRALGQARSLIARHRTDILHTHNAMAHYQGVVAELGLGVAGVINTRHGMDNQTGAGRHERRKQWLYRQTLRRTDAVVCVCEAAHRDAVARGTVPATKTRVVPNGIGVEAFAPASAAMRARLHQILDLPDAVRILGNVGRLNWAKDQAGLIRAFARVHAQRPDTALVLIGDGALRSSLEQLSAEQGVSGAVRFLGDRNDVPLLLQGLDLFVLSSLSEGYSIALLEASAAALPIVATDVGGNREIVHHDVTGQVVPVSNPAALAQALLTLLDDQPQAQAYGRAAREWVHQYGSLQTMAARYEDLYRSQLACA